MPTLARLDRSRSLLAAALAAMVLSAALLGLAPAGGQATAGGRAAVDPAVAAATGDAVKVVVQATAGAAEAARRAVERIGGAVTRDLPIVGGLSATIPAAAVGELAADPVVRVLSLDRRMRVLQSTEPSSLKSVYPKVARADDAWKAGLTGRGVTVALVDTGIAEVADLAGRVLPVTDDVTGVTTSCKNLSGESGCADSYGHGTFIAGIIAGDGASSGGAWKGIAPEANLLSVKIAGADGSADVSNVLASP